MYLHVRGLGPVFLGALPMCTLQTCSKMMAFSDGVGSGGGGDPFPGHVYFN